MFKASSHCKVSFIDDPKSIFNINLKTLASPLPHDFFSCFVVAQLTKLNCHL